jgi:polyisoprenoid-binding protein YceI
MNTPRATVPLDATNTRVSFSVRWFGVVRVSGSFGAVGGLIEAGQPGDDPRITVYVEAQSVQTGIGLRDRHLRGLRFLDSARHPQVVFESRRVSHHNGVWDVRGALTLRGQVRDVSVSVLDEAASPTERRLTAEFSVPRQPHAIGTASGIRRLNPLLWAIGGDVQVRVQILVPATLLSPQPARAH